MNADELADAMRLSALVNRDDVDDLDWSEAIKLAKSAIELRARLDILVEKHSEFIAKLTCTQAVEQVGVRQFCRETGLNYGTVRNWRVAYRGHE